jgi:hypothetical protein
MTTRPTTTRIRVKVLSSTGFSEERILRAKTEIIERNICYLLGF